jgi:hypothetical protein
MKSAECNGSGNAQPAGWRSRDGRLWFPTQKGIVAVDPAPRPAVAIVVRYGPFGRLLMVTPDGLQASEPAARCAHAERLVASRSGDRRLLVYSRCDDWPMSCCGGAFFGIWEWNGRTLVTRASRLFSVPRPGCADDSRIARVLFRHGRWLKLYGRDGETLKAPCSGPEPRRLWKIRVDADGVRDFGMHHIVAEVEAADVLLHRIITRGHTDALATPDAARRAAELLDGMDWLGLFHGYRVRRGAQRSDVLVAGDERALWITLERRGGRLYAVDARPAAEDEARDPGNVVETAPPLTGGNTATSSPSASR